MFVYYFANVGRPCDEIRDHVMALDLAGWAEEAYRNAEALRSRLVDASFEASTVTFHASDPIERSNHAVLALRWSATGPAGLFSDLQGDLVIAPIGPNRCQLSLRGSYRLPPGADRSLFHRLTEACVKSFVDRVAGALGRTSIGELVV